MPSPIRLQKSHLYSVYFAPRGSARMVELGMQIAQLYLSPFDNLIGLVGEAGSGKSMLIKGMFPGLELTNDDGGVNIRPLPILNDDTPTFYNAHTYHIDAHFEIAFTQPFEIAEAVQRAVAGGKRVVIEHYDLLYPFLHTNAHLLIGIGEEVIITRPTLFGPEPEDIKKLVFRSFYHRRQAHTAEDICEFCLEEQGITERDFEHSDVRHGFILSFEHEVRIDFDALEKRIDWHIKNGTPVSYCDDAHVYIGETRHHCTGPRVHVSSAAELAGFRLMKQLFPDPTTGRYLLVGLLGENAGARISELNRFTYEGL